jgi:hypothetical protein
VLHPYTEGVYGTILNSEAEMDLASYKMLCFDLENIQKDKLLYPIVTMQLIALVMQHIAKFPEVYKQVKFDEAWSFLSGDMVEFIEYLFRTVRKHHRRVTIITQSVADVKKSEVGGMMLNNSHVITLLNHTGQDLALVREVLDIDDREIALLASMRLGWQTWDKRRGGVMVRDYARMRLSMVSVCLGSLGCMMAACLALLYKNSRLTDRINREIFVAVESKVYKAFPNDRGLDEKDLKLFVKSVCYNMFQHDQLSYGERTGGD